MQQIFINFRSVSSLLLSFIVCLTACKKSDSNTSTQNSSGQQGAGQGSTQPTQNSINWKTTIGGSMEDQFRETTSIVKTPDGGYVTAGTTSSTDGDIAGYHGGGDIVVIKVDNTGKKVWTKVFGGSGEDGAYSVTGTSDGGFIVAAYTYSQDGNITLNHGSMDAWIIKLDANGTIVWQKTYGGTGGDEVVAIVETSDGYICTGASESNNGDVKSNNGNSDVWVFKIDKNGNLLWSKSYGGSLVEWFISLTATTDGNFIAIGFTQSNDGDLKNNHGNGDMLILKFDPGGNLIWCRTFGGGGVDFGINITNSEDGGYFICGSSQGGGDIDVPSKGLDDAIIAKLDANGNKVWVKTYGSSAKDIANSVKITADHYLIVTGVAGTHDRDVLPGTTNHDAWVLKLDNTGKIISQTTLGGSGTDEGKYVIDTGNNSYVLTGFVMSSDGDIPSTHGGADIFLTSFNLK